MQKGYDSISVDEVEDNKTKLFLMSNSFINSKNNGDEIHWEVSIFSLYSIYITSK